MTSTARDGSKPVEIWLVDAARSRSLCQELQREERWVDAIEAAELVPEGAAPEQSERLLARVALKTLLSRHLPQKRLRGPLARSSTGRPYVDGAALEFSVSHTLGLVAIGIAQSGPIGIDVEAARPRSLSDANRDRLLAAAVGLAGPLPDGEHQLLSAWVRIEAVAKALGTGVGALLGRIGARKGAGLGGAEITERARSVVDHARLSVRAIEGVIGAVAAGCASKIGPVRRFPATRAELDALRAEVS
jgi:4'-phosphopantetheinyl transferase